jgi:hypothetical protein
MLAAVKAVIENNLARRCSSGSSAGEVRLQDRLLRRTGGKGVAAIFADVPLSLDDYLPVMDSEADVFIMLGITDDVASIHDGGVPWANIAANYGTPPIPCTPP